MSNPTTDKQPGGETNKIVINDIQIQSVNRNPKDVLQWRNAHIAATAVLNPNRTRLYDIYDDILVDGHLSGIIGKRIDTVLNKPLYYHDKNGKKVDGMDAVINSTVFRNILRTIMETQLWGISGMEFVPGDEMAFIEVPRKHIKPKWRIISLQQNENTGIAYDEHPAIWVIGESKDLGLLLKCAPYAIYKRGAMADWSNFVEIFGIPMRVIEYDANDEQTKIELKQILDESGSALALMIPKQASFKTMDGKQTNGDGQLQESFKDSLNAEMSLIILGNTETSTQTGNKGTNAKAKTHSEQQGEIAKSDIIYCTNTLNDKRFATILKTYGLPVSDGGQFVFKKDIDITFLAQRIEIDKGVKELGTPIDDDYVYETYGIPKPANYDELKAAQKAIKEQPAPEDPEKDKPAPGKKPKPTKLVSHSKLKNLVEAFKDVLPFFDPARH